jgi:hypothetical protein
LISGPGDQGWRKSGAPSSPLRNLVERFSNRIKHFRAIATRYEKHAENYLALVKLGATRIWLRAVADLDFALLTKVNAARANVRVRSGRMSLPRTVRSMSIDECRGKLPIKNIR